MDATKLPFDADAMLAGLRPWVECESPTWDTARIGAMMDVASRDLALLGARIERIGGRMGFGDCVRASFATIFDGFREIVHDLSAAERRALFRDNAIRLYGME